VASALGSFRRAGPADSALTTSPQDHGTDHEPHDPTHDPANRLNALEPVESLREPVLLVEMPARNDMIHATAKQPRPSARNMNPTKQVWPQAQPSSSVIPAHCVPCQNLAR